MLAIPLQDIYHLDDIGFRLQVHRLHSHFGCTSFQYISNDKLQNGLRLAVHLNATQMDLLTASEKARL